MSMLDNMGTTVEDLANRAVDNPVGDAIDKANASLQGSSGSTSAGNAHFLLGEPLDATRVPPASAQTPITSDMPPPSQSLKLAITPPLQFLNLCRTHDAVANKFPGRATSQGIAMRDALIREAVLLHSFANASKNVTAKAKADKGAAGAMLDTASSLLGGSTQSTPGPEAFDAVLSKLRSAADPVNQSSFDYLAIHQAGKALAEAADMHHQLCKKAFKPAGGGGAGLPSIPGLSTMLGNTGVPDIVGKIPEWLFKAQDAYVAMYAAARNAYEWPLMQVSHDYSLQAIRGQWLPTYDIWRVRNQEATRAVVEEDNPSAAESLLNGVQQSLDGTGLRSLGKALGLQEFEDAYGDLGKAQSEVAKQRNEAKNKASKLIGQLNTAKSAQANMPPEAVAALAAACQVLNGNSSRKIPPLGELMAQALGQSLAGRPLPGFMQTWCKLLATQCSELIASVLQATHASQTGPDPATIVTQIHLSLADKVVGMVYQLIFGHLPEDNDMSGQQRSARRAVDDAGSLQFGQALTDAGSVVPSLGQLSNKAADMVAHFLATQANKINRIVLFVAWDLCRELTEAWKEARYKEAMTMEAYIGRIPMLAATLMRNLIFPLFNLVMDAFGLSDKLAGKVWNPVSQKIGEVQAVSQIVKDYKDDIPQTGKDVHDGATRVDKQLDSITKRTVDNITALSSADVADAPNGFGRQQGAANDLAKNITGAPNELIGAAKGDPPEGKQDTTAHAMASGSGPVSSNRVADGEAQKVSKAQIDSAGYERPPQVAEAEKDFLTARG